MFSAEVSPLMGRWYSAPRDTRRTKSKTAGSFRAYAPHPVDRQEIYRNGLDYIT